MARKSVIDIDLGCLPLVLVLLLLGGLGFCGDDECQADILRGIRTVREAAR